MYFNESCSPPDSANTLWYDPTINRFEDESGHVVHDLYSHFDTWQLDQWKKTQEYALMTDKNGDLWELFYNQHGLHGRCCHLCEPCLSKCEIYDLVRDWEGVS